jgi:hypothetical protein
MMNIILNSNRPDWNSKLAFGLNCEESLGFGCLYCKREKHVMMRTDP